MNRIDNPAGVILSRLNTSIINPEIRAKLKRCFNDIPAIAHIFKYDITDPEIRFHFSCFFNIYFKGNNSADFTFDNKPFPFHQIQSFQQRKFNFPTFNNVSKTRLIIKFTRVIGRLRNNTFSSKDAHHRFFLFLFRLFQ